MARAKKDGCHVRLYMERPVAEKLEEYCKETGLPKTAAIETALKELFRK